LRDWRQLLGRLAPARRAEAPEPADRPETAPAQGGNVVVTVLGLSGDALEQVLTLAERQCAARGSRPVFVTDGLDFAPFRRRRLIADQVIDAEALAAGSPDLPWQAYRRRQYALLAARWQPVAVISFGRAPGADCLAALEGPGRTAAR
jgi:hypothetical protein